MQGIFQALRKAFFMAVSAVTLGLELWAWLLGLPRATNVIQEPAGAQL